MTLQDAENTVILAGEQLADSAGTFVTNVLTDADAPTTIKSLFNVATAFAGLVFLAGQVRRWRMTDGENKRN